MAIIKLKNGTTTPSSLSKGELALNRTNNQLFIGNAAGSPIKLVGGIASQLSSNVTVSGGTIVVPTITATNAKVSNLTWSNGERLYYDEGGSAGSYTANWNYTETTNMTQFADFGNVTAHGWGGSARTYQLTLSGLPTHTEIMYECVIHMVDSLDSEGYFYLYTSNSANGDITQAQWYKNYSSSPYNLTVYNSTTFNWKGGQYYSYAPWGGSNAVQPVGGNGYTIINTGWYSHNSSSFIAKHAIPLDQPSTDEAVYISHVKVWIRGGSSNTITSIPASVSYDTSTLPTQAAVKSFIDSNYVGSLKNLYSFTGSSTYTKSGTDVKVIRVVCVGAGGGGRGYHESGGGGGYAERMLDASQISSVAVTVGTGGAGGYYFGFSGQGGTTSFGSYVSATGGYGANQNKSHAGGHGGIGSGGTANYYGGGGGGHAPGFSNQQGGESSLGGGTYFGGSAAGRHGGNSYSDVAAPGAGAFGGAGNHNGGNGYAGICLVYEYR